MGLSLVFAALLCFMGKVYANHGPMASCCTQWSTTLQKVPFTRLLDYTIQSEGVCPIKAIVFQAKRGKRICSDPNDDRTKQAILKVDAEKKKTALQQQGHNEEGLTSDVTPATSTTSTNAPATYVTPAKSATSTNVPATFTTSTSTPATSTTSTNAPATSTTSTSTPATSTTSTNAPATSTTSTNAPATSTTSTSTPATSTTSTNAPATSTTSTNAPATCVKPATSTTSTNAPKKKGRRGRKRQGKKSRKWRKLQQRTRV